MTAETVTVSPPGPPSGSASSWVAVCRLGDLEPERGVAALIEGRQVALFRTWSGDLYAVDHRDPFSGAHVMARGIVGSRGAVPTVASPMYKQVFDLRTGCCLDQPDVVLGTHPVRVLAGVVEVLVEALDAGPG